MAKDYKHLSVEERALVQTQLEQGFKLRAIAGSLNRAPSTVTRELARNGWRSSQARA